MGSSKTRRRAVQPDPLAAYMIRHKLVGGKPGTRFVSEQGTKMGRRSFLHVEIQGEQGADGIYVGGHVTPMAEGVMTLDSRADANKTRNARRPTRRRSRPVSAV